MSIIGAHVSSAGSLDLSIDRAKSIGAKCMQLFISPPQQWIQSKHPDEKLFSFKEKAKKEGIGPNFIHGTYLINLGTENPEHLQKSIDWLRYALGVAEKMGVKGVIFHLGSHKGREFSEVLPQIVKSLSVILEQAEGAAIESTNQERSYQPLRGFQDDTLPYLVLENSAGAGATIGDTFEELGEILKRVQNDGHKDRLKICLDTCHAYSCDYDLKTKEGIKQTLELFDKVIGLENLVAIHANDTKFDKGSHKDRHENIGEGFLGKEGFKNLLSNPLLRDVPFILEVPGFTKTGPDKENVEALLSLVDK